MPNVGSLKNINALFFIKEIKSDFSNFEIIELKVEIINLEEGLLHNVQGSVIRFVGRKL